MPRAGIFTDSRKKMATLFALIFLLIPVLSFSLPATAYGASVISLLNGSALTAEMKGPAPQPAAPLPPKETPPLTKEEAQTLANVLENPASRAALINAVNQAAAEKPGAEPLATASAEAASSANLPENSHAQKLKVSADGLGMLLLNGTAHIVTQTFQQADIALKKLISKKEIADWFKTITKTPVLQDAMLKAVWQTALIFFIAFLCGLLTRQTLTKTRRRLANYSLSQRAFHPGYAIGESLLARTLPRFIFFLGSFCLALIPLFAFLIVGYILPFILFRGSKYTLLTCFITVITYFCYRFILIFTASLFWPGVQRISLFPVSEEGGKNFIRIIRKLLLITATGYGFFEICNVFGLPSDVRDNLDKLVLLLVCLQLIYVILRKRKTVSGFLHTRDKDAYNFFSIFRNGFARIWYIAVIFYIVIFWVMLLIGFSPAAQIAGILAAFFSVLIGRVFYSSVLYLMHTRVKPEEHPDSLFINRLYHRRRLIRSLSGICGFFITVFLFSALIGIPILAWLHQNPIGILIGEAMMKIAVVLFVVFLVWELIDASFEARLNFLIAQGREGRAARLRTLSPILRTSLLVALISVFCLTVLSELGVNIAPLLAGAGVIGIAVGFGSQKLVQDVITGIFILFEDAAKVGDYVSLAGLTGTVENLSIRTIRLRAFDGAMHVIPFSAVTSISNLTKDYSNVLFKIGVGYKENVDRVSTVITELGKELRKDPDFKEAILNDLELWGLDEFGNSSIVIAFRIKTKPEDRWRIRREFNRRIKLRFDELGIELPFTYSRLSIDPTEWKEAFSGMSATGQNSDSMQGEPSAEEGDFSVETQFMQGASASPGLTGHKKTLPGKTGVPGSEEKNSAKTQLSPEATGRLEALPGEEEPAPGAKPVYPSMPSGPVQLP